MFPIFSMLEIGVCAETSVGFLQRQNIDFHARSSIVLTISSPSSALWDVRQATFQFVQDMFLPSQKRSGPGRYLFPIIENSSKVERCRSIRRRNKLRVKERPVLAFSVITCSGFVAKNGLVEVIYEYVFLCMLATVSQFSDRAKAAPVPS